MTLDGVTVAAYYNSQQDGNRLRSFFDNRIFFGFWFGVYFVDFREWRKLELFNYVYGIVVMVMFVVIAVCCVIVTLDAITKSKEK